MLEIFKFLPSEDLKLASTVCKDWRKMIFLSKKLFGKWTLKVDFGAKLQKKEPLKVVKKSIAK